MKTTISGVLVGNAIDYVSQAREAAQLNHPDKEISLCISAHVMIAIALEGIANEIGDVVFVT